MKKLDIEIESKIKTLDKDAKWANIPDFFFQFRAPSVTLPLVLIDAIFPEVYKYNINPLPFCSTVTEAQISDSNPITGCNIEVMETDEDQPIVFINGIPKKLSTASPVISQNSQPTQFSQSSEPLFNTSSQSSNRSSPPLKKVKVPSKKVEAPSTQTQIANMFSQPPASTQSLWDICTQEVKIEPYEG